MSDQIDPQDTEPEHNPDFIISDNFDIVEKELEEFKKREAAKALEQNPNSTNNPQENQKELTYNSNSSSLESNLEQVKKDIAGFLKEQTAKALEQNPTSINNPQEKPKNLKKAQAALDISIMSLAKAIVIYGNMNEHIDYLSNDFNDDEKEDVDYLFSLFPKYEDIFVETYDYKEIIAEELKLRLGFKASVKAIAKALEVQEERYEQRFFGLDSNIKQTCKELFTELIDDLDNPKSPMLKTGFDYWDMHLGGGFYESGMHVLAGASGRGKSALAIQVATNVALSGQKVLYFSMEMNGKQNIARVISSVNKDINSSRILSKSLKSEERAKLNALQDNVSSLPLWFSEKSSIEDIVNVSKSFFKVGSPGLDLIVIDYVQMIQTDTSFKTPEQQIALVTRKLRYLAKKYKVRLLVLAQMNEKDREKPTIGNLRSSAAIGHYAETLTFICHKEAEPIRKKNEEEKEDSKPEATLPLIWLHVEKNRNGSPGVHPEISMDYQFFKETGLFRQEQSLHDKDIETQATSEAAKAQGEENQGHLRTGSSKNLLPRVIIPRK